MNCDPDHLLRGGQGRMPADLEHSASVVSWCMTGFVLILVFAAVSTLLPGCAEIPQQFHNEDYHGDTLKNPRTVDEQVERIRSDRLPLDWREFRKINTF